MESSTVVQVRLPKPMVKGCFLQRAEFRSALEDRVTHRYQNPWHAPPHFLDKQSVGARSKLAWTHKYDCYIRDNNKQFLLNRRD